MWLDHFPSSASTVVDVFTRVLKALHDSHACAVLHHAVEAYVVTIRDAAAPEHRGLLQPLLKRYQARRCSSAVFALPAAQAVIQFK